MLQWCEQDKKDKDEFFRLISINRHRKNENAKGGWQVNVRWASGLADWQDINDIFRDDPVMLSLSTKKNDLLELPGWK